MVKISVIVPVYKVEKYLNRCIESIAGQTYKDLEIILVDDGSPDGCPAICDEWAKNDGRIRVIHKKNAGLVAARKSGLKEAGGEYIAFVDGDDYISKYMYEKVAGAIEKYSPDMVLTEFFWSYEDKDMPSERTLFKPYYDRQAIEKEIVPSMLFSGEYYKFGVYPNCWTKITKKPLLEKNLIPVDESIRLGEDAAFTYGCIMESGSIAVVPEPLYFYRTLSTSMSNSYDKNLKNTWYLPYLSIKNKASKRGINIDSQLSYYLLYLMNFAVRNEASAGNENKDKNALKTLLKCGLIKDLKHVDRSSLPFHTKILYSALKSGNLPLLKLYKSSLRVLFKWKNT